ncbi:hypothetical protein H0H93_009127 [Arthromyces matolae]|nr:hypothetical protein H0H93_009127 [Arthromyces matolae]
MKHPWLILVLLAGILAVTANIPHDGRSLGHHAKVFARSPSPSSTKIRINRRSCAKRPKSSSSETEPTSTKKTTPTSTKTPATSPTKVASSGSKSQFLVEASYSACGNSGATQKTQKTSGPNGSIDWLNCGLDGSGWNPPHVNVSGLVYVDLQTALDSGDSPFKQCKSFISYFYKYGNEYNVPPIMLASFAMQESSCRADLTGGAGEQGLMQITKDKCGGAPNGNCKDPDFNIKTATAYFAGQLKANGGNVILTVGAYNGWYKGLTILSPHRPKLLPLPTSAADANKIVTSEFRPCSSHSFLY